MSRRATSGLLARYRMPTAGPNGAAIEDMSVRTCPESVSVAWDNLTDFRRVHQVIAHRPRDLMNIIAPTRPSAVPPAIRQLERLVTNVSTQADILREVSHVTIPVGMMSPEVREQLNRGIYAAQSGLQDALAARFLVDHPSGSDSMPAFVRDAVRSMVEAAQGLTRAEGVLRYVSYASAVHTPNEYPLEGVEAVADLLGDRSRDALAAVKRAFATS